MALGGQTRARGWADERQLERDAPQPLAQRLGLAYAERRQRAIGGALVAPGLIQLGLTVPDQPDACAHTCQQSVVEFSPVLQLTTDYELRTKSYY